MEKFYVVVIDLYKTGLNYSGICFDSLESSMNYLNVIRNTITTFGYEICDEKGQRLDFIYSIRGILKRTLEFSELTTNPDISELVYHFFCSR